MNDNEKIDKDAILATSKVVRELLTVLERECELLVKAYGPDETWQIFYKAIVVVTATVIEGAVRDEMAYEKAVTFMVADVLAIIKNRQEKRRSGQDYVGSEILGWTKH